jgi:membrane associated rhomboid family serine protease
VETRLSAPAEIPSSHNVSRCLESRRLFHHRFGAALRVEQFCTSVPCPKPHTRVRGEWWRLISYSFVQARLLHLLSNVVLLLFLGRLVECQLEPANFVLLLVATAVSGAVIDTLFRTRNFTAIGSSGMVFGLIGALLSFYILGRVPLSRWALVRRLSLLGGLSLMSLVAEFLLLRRVNLIHIGGLAAGVLFGSVVPLKPVEKANEEKDS